MTENALKGIYNGGTIPFGYMIDETRHYQPDPLLAPYVEQTFQKYADGATMTDLRDWLKAHNDRKIQWAGDVLQYDSADAE